MVVAVMMMVTQIIQLFKFARNVSVNGNSCFTLIAFTHANIYVLPGRSPESILV